MFPNRSLGTMLKFLSVTYSQRKCSEVEIKLPWLAMLQNNLGYPGAYTLQSIYFQMQINKNKK